MPSSWPTAYAAAYTAARRASVAAGSEASRDGARAALEALEARLAEVEAGLRDVDPFLLSLAQSASVPTADGETPALEIPAGTSLDAVLLAYEHRSLVQRIESTKETYAETAIESLLPQAYATTVERLLPRQVTPELPSPMVPIAVAVAIGLLLAVAVPVVIDRLDHSIRDPRVASDVLAAPVLSTIPASLSESLTTLASPGSERDSAYRRLAAASIATDQLPRAIVVTSPVGHMQDSVAANFAAALAGLGLRVALVATDARQAWYAAEEDGDALTLPDLSGDGPRREPQRARQGEPDDHAGREPAGRPSRRHRRRRAPGRPPAAAAGLCRRRHRRHRDRGVLRCWRSRRPPSSPGAPAACSGSSSPARSPRHEAREAADRLALAGATPFGVAMVDEG